MSGGETFTRIADLVRPLLRLDRTAFVSPTAQLGRDLLMDSLDRQSLACEIEEEFGIEVPDDEVTSWCTLEQVTATVTRLSQPQRKGRVAQPNYAALGLGSAADAEGRN